MASDFKYDSEIERMKKLLRKQAAATLISAVGTATGAVFVAVSAAKRNSADIFFSPIYAAYFSTLLGDSIRGMRRTIREIRRSGSR